jgi:ABC-type multidrug transport system fused ATPase/permease subunit
MAACLLLVVSRLCGFVLPLSFRFFLDRILGQDDLTRLNRLVAFILLATAVQAVAQLLLVRVVGVASARLSATIQARVQFHVSRLPMAFFDARQKGALTARIMKDGGRVADVLSVATLDVAGWQLTGVLAVAWIFHLDARLAAVSIACLVTLAGAMHFGSRGVRPLYERYSAIESSLSGRLTQWLGGVRVVKAYAAESRCAATFSVGAHQLGEAGVTLTQKQGLLTLATSLALAGAGAGLTFMATRELAHGRLTTGSAATFAVLLGYATAAARQLGGLRMQWARSLAALEWTESILRQLAEGQEPGRTLNLPRKSLTVSFRDVHFAYQPGKEVVHGISFDAEPGTVTALVGASGAGKSTIFSLLCGFYTPGGGAILIDGIDQQTLKLDSYRACLGLVPQEPFLFSGSLRENVLFARPEASEADFREACRMAHVDEFALRLPAAYETPVGERGVRLSGGQQQRLCLARAVLADAPILLLDEATSSLDSESEAYIQQSLDVLSHRRTVLVIAHRLSTIQRADQILVLAGGRIVERGTHASLLASEGVYAGFHASQNGADRASSLTAPSPASAR